MSLVDLKILSYHRFTNEDDQYAFSRTYKAFRHDLETKDFDWITIDDGHKSMIKACKMMADANVRAKLFISTSLIGTDGYCTWADIWRLSRKHDIENHSHEHVRMDELTYRGVYYNIDTASEHIHQHTGRRPRYFVPPWNANCLEVKDTCKLLELQVITDRINILNNTR